MVNSLSKNNKIISINRKKSKVRKEKNTINYGINILDYKEVYKMIYKLKKNKNLPDIFILNAGINIYDNVKFFSYKNFKLCFETNFNGSINFVGALEEQKIKNKKIIFLSSTSNIIPNPAAFGYYSSKLLLKKIVNFLNKNNTNKYKSVILGPIETKISRHLKKPQGIAGIIYNFLKVSPKYSINAILKFIDNDKNFLYFTKKSLLIYLCISLVLKFFPFLYKGGK